MSQYLHRPIFVTGLPRSGTSMVAGLMNACGAWTGTTVQGNAENPKGYFEHSVIRESVTKQILLQLGHDPLGVKSIPDFLPGLETKGLEQTLASIITSDGYGDDRPWLYKEAKLTLIWPAFARAFPQAQWIIVSRDREDIIDSCLRTSFMSQHSGDREFWKIFVDAYLERLDLLKQHQKKLLLIETDKLFSGDYSQLQCAIEQCGLVFDDGLIEEFICQDYWHSDK